jgi:hypothetical protein
MQDEPIDGWMAPVYHAMAAPSALLMAGVPQTFLILDVLGTLLLTIIGMMVIGPQCWRVLVIGAAVYLIAVVGTGYEPNWWDMLKAYRQYSDFYEG